MHPFRIGIRRWAVGLTWLFALGSLPAGPLAGVGTDRLVLTRQSTARFQCGPTTLASVLAFRGVPVPEAEIAAVLYSPTARGVLLTDLAWFARRQGFLTEVQTGTVAGLQAELAARRPPIVLLDLGFAGLRQPHFTAVIGWEAEGVWLLSTRAGGTRVPAKTFARQWSRAGNQCLLITPSS